MSGQQVALVTGAAGGIGAAIVSRLCRDGYAVVAADRRRPDPVGGAATTVLELGYDVADDQACASATSEILRRFGRLDVLVTSAGIAGRAAPIEAQSSADWQRMIDINLSGVFYSCRAAIVPMKLQGYGRIVNIASIAGKEGNPNMVPYSAAKAGVIGLTKALAKEVATSGILVHAVAPAVIHTGLLDQLTESQVAYMTERIPMRRPGRPEEVASLVAFLISAECTFTTGFVHDLSGGRATY